MFGWLFTNAVSALGVLFGWLSPTFGLAVYYLLAILRPSFLWHWSVDPSNRYSFLVALSTLVGWSLRGFCNWRGLRHIWIPLGGYAAYCVTGVLATQWAVDPDRAWLYLLPQLKIGLMGLVTVTVVRSKRQILSLAWIVLASATYLAYQFNYEYIVQGWNRVYLRGFGSVDGNGVAMIMATATPLPVFIALHSQRNWLRAACLLAVLLMVHVVLFSFSRGGMLGLVIVELGVLYYTPKSPRTVALIALLVGASLYMAGPSVQREFMSMFVEREQLDASAASRFDTWSAAIACMRDHPGGVGPRNFNLVSDQYGLTPGKSVHNLFLQTGADYGVIGMLGLLAFYVGSAVSCWKVARRVRHRGPLWIRTLLEATTVSIGAFTVCSMFIGMESVEIASTICLVGLCACLHYHTEQSPTTRPEQPPATPFELPALQPPRRDMFGRAPMPERFAPTTGDDAP